MRRGMTGRVRSLGPVALLATLLLGVFQPGAGTAQGGVIQFLSKSAFTAQTSEALVGNWDDYYQGLAVVPPYRQGITFTEASYVVGANTLAGNNPPLIWNPIRNTTLFAFAPQISGNIDTSPNRYSSFGFDLGYLNNFVSATHPATTATLYLTTNDPSGFGNNPKYTFTVSMPGSEESFAFLGFKTDNADEYFTAFQVVGPASYFPGISEWRLGNPRAPSPTIPEPGVCSLATVGVLAGWLWARRNRLAQC